MARAMGSEVKDAGERMPLLLHADARAGGAVAGSDFPPPAAAAAAGVAEPAAFELLPPAGAGAGAMNELSSSGLRGSRARVSISGAGAPHAPATPWGLTAGGCLP